MTSGFYRQGVEEGKNEMQLAIAKKQLNSGLSVELVAEYTGLTIAEVAALKANMSN